jgi:hypothetical protein
MTMLGAGGARNSPFSVTLAWVQVRPTFWKYRQFRARRPGTKPLNACPCQCSMTRGDRRPASRRAQASLTVSNVIVRGGKAPNLLPSDPRR